MDVPRYNIRAVERMTGVPAATLRSWERRYGFPAPDRSATARRLYADSEVAAIRWIKARTEAGLSVAQAVQQVQAAAAAPPARAVTGRPTDLVQRFVAAIARYDEAAAEQALSAAFARFPADVVITELLTPALVAVGDAWARGELAVSAEHFASGLVRRRLFSMLAALPELGVAPTVVLACVPDEHHEIGLTMLALFLRWAGVHVVNLGADVPVADLIRCVRDTSAAAICLSAIHPGAAATLPAVVETLRTAGIGLPLFAGGPHLPPHLGPNVQIPAGDLRDAALQIAETVQSA